MFQVRSMSSVAAVAAEDAIDHGADNGNAIARASAIAVAITGAAVVDRTAAAMTDRGLSSATTMPAGMAGSQRIRRHWHATQRDRGREGDESLFVKHVILLCFKQKFVCDCTGNADRRQGLQGKGTRLRVGPRCASP